MGAPQLWARRWTSGEPLRRCYGRNALSLTVVSVLLLLAIATVGDVAVVREVSAATQADLRATAALYMVFVSVLTLPHVAIVTWMDWAENTGLARLVDEQ